MNFVKHKTKEILPMKRSLIAVVLTFLAVLSAVPAVTFADEPVQAFGHAAPVRKDYGPEPYVDRLFRLARKNPNYRAAVWTGKELQLTAMSIPKGGEVGLEVHVDTDQFLYVVEGTGTAMMGTASDKLDYTRPVAVGSGVFVPTGTWHNLLNTGDGDLKLFTVYAPPHHPHGTVQKTKAEADAAEEKEK